MLAKHGSKADKAHIKKILANEKGSAELILFTITDVYLVKSRSSLTQINQQY